MKHFVIAVTVALTLACTLAPAFAYESPHNAVPKKPGEPESASPPPPPPPAIYEADKQACRNTYDECKITCVESDPCMQACDKKYKECMGEDEDER